MEREETLKRTERLGIRKNEEGKILHLRGSGVCGACVESVLKKEILSCDYFCLSFPRCLPLELR